MNDIDIVVRWVDNNDLIWQKEKQKYVMLEKECKRKDADFSIERYRDWDLLRYWFRGIEANAPWVRKVFFITCGHRPAWLNLKHPKLELVEHKDFIPAKWLPTFSSRTIDFNIYRIDQLSNKFVFFDDDMYLIKKTKETDFFVENQPCDSMVFNVITALFQDNIGQNIFNNMTFINKNFPKSKLNRKNLLKLFTLKYGRYLYKNFVLFPWKYYLGFQDFHLPESLLKSTFEEIWERESEILESTCSHKFRQSGDVNQWLIRYWQLVDFNFYPRITNIGKYFEITNDNREIIRAIKTKKYKMICLNEGKPGSIIDFDNQKKRLQRAFQEVFPYKSGYEI